MAMFDREKQSDSHNESNHILPSMHSTRSRYLIMGER